LMSVNSSKPDVYFYHATGSQKVSRLRRLCCRRQDRPQYLNHRFFNPRSLL